MSQRAEAFQAFQAFEASSISSISSISSMFICAPLCTSIWKTVPHRSPFLEAISEVGLWISEQRHRPNPQPRRKAPSGHMWSRHVTPTFSSCLKSSFGRKVSPFTKFHFVSGIDPPRFHVPRPEQANALATPCHTLQLWTRSKVFLANWLNYSMRIGRNMTK